jgi:hypothetical protein
MLETRQLHPSLAPEVVGLRLWERLDDATVAELRGRLVHHTGIVANRGRFPE